MIDVFLWVFAMSYNCVQINKNFAVSFAAILFDHLTFRCQGCVQFCGNDNSSDTKEDDLVHFNPRW